jgi:hypothetical protein
VQQVLRDFDRAVHPGIIPWIAIEKQGATSPSCAAVKGLIPRPQFGIESAFDRAEGAVAFPRRGVGDLHREVSGLDVSMPWKAERHGESALAVTGVLAYPAGPVSHR